MWLCALGVTVLRLCMRFCCVLFGVEKRDQKFRKAPVNVSATFLTGSFRGGRILLPSHSDFAKFEWVQKQIAFHANLHTSRLVPISTTTAKHDGSRFRKDGIVQICLVRFATSNSSDLFCFPQKQTMDYGPRKFEQLTTTHGMHHVFVHAHTCALHSYTSEYNFSLRQNLHLTITIITLNFHIPSSDVQQPASFHAPIH